MGMLGKPLGIFRLDDSDRYIGSYLSINDICFILETSSSDLERELNFELINDEKFVDEQSLPKVWQSNKLPNALKPKIGNSTVSLDEYIIAAIIKQNYPNFEVTHQLNWGRKYIDLKIKTDKNEEFFIEFHGPGHFTIQNNRTPDDPMKRKKEIENEFKIPCYIWPYWIQRSKNNFDVLLGKSDIGYGALWSTKIFFGDFIFENSNQIIHEITKVFKANINGYGYFYDSFNDFRVKKEHPIVEKILNNKIKNGIYRLVPKSKSIMSKNKLKEWLPEKLHSLIK
jgi:hypothetical protein